MADGKPGPPLGNNNGGKVAYLEQVLRRAVLADDGKRLRKGCEIIIDRFSKDGNLPDGRFIRDTLDGTPKQRVDISSEDGSALQSLQVMFVQAAQGRILEHAREAVESLPEPLPTLAEDFSHLKDNE